MIIPLADAISLLTKENVEFFEVQVDMFKVINSTYILDIKIHVQVNCSGSATRDRDFP